MVTIHLIIYIHDSLNTKIRTAIAQELSKSKELIPREEELQNMLKEIESTKRSVHDMKSYGKT